MKSSPLSAKSSASRLRSLHKVARMKHPKLRFKEFDGGWQETRIGKVLCKVSNPVDVDPGAKYAQIGIRSHCKGIFHKEPVTGESLGDKRVFWVEPDALVLNIVFAWEQAVAVTGERERGMVASHRFPMYLGKDGQAEPNFISLLFQTRKGKALLEMASPGGAGRNKTLGQKEFEELKIVLPSAPEQRKISTFFAAFEARLQMQETRIKLLQEYRRSLSSRIFQQEIKFKDSNGINFPAWEEKKLEEILTVRYGKDHKHLGQGKIPLLGTGGVMKYVDRALYDKPSVLIGRKGTIDKPQFISEPFWTVDTLFYTEISEGYLPYFAYLAVNQVDWKKHNQATGVPSLNTEAINNAKVTVPVSLEEQGKITDFLGAVDAKIDQAERAFKASKSFKASLLQQMLI